MKSESANPGCKTAPTALRGIERHTATLSVLDGTERVSGRQTVVRNLDGGRA